MAWLWLVLALPVVLPAAPAPRPKRLAAGAAEQAATDDATEAPAPPPVPLVVNPDLVVALAELPPIPKKLHIIFPSADVVDSKDEMVVLGVRQMIDMHPGWSFKVYDHDAVDQYLRKELTRDEPMLSAADVELVLKAHIVERTDAARLLIMWHEGGFYQVGCPAPPHLVLRRLSLRYSVAPLATAALAGAPKWQRASDGAACPHVGRLRMHPDDSRGAGNGARRSLVPRLTRSPRRITLRRTSTGSTTSR